MPARKDISDQQIRAALARSGGMVSAAAHFLGIAPITLQRRLAANPMLKLSDRELEVFRLIGKGYSTRQIAEELHLSIKTIESHRAHIKEKLNLKNAMELVQHAIQWQEA